MSNPLPPMVFLMGPTAAGKTDAAVELVQRLPFSIISVDSAMIYRDMDIGTAKPEAEVLERAPHRLIDFLDPAESYSVARFRDDVLREAADIHAQGRIPLLVGGTMLYYRALEYGLSPLPEADATVRAELEEEARRFGWEHLHSQLRQVDPISAERIHPNDPQRLQRALEVYRISGKSLSELQKVEGEGVPYRLLKLAIAPQDRDWLRQRIARRFHLMLEQGFVEEVERLYRRGDLSTENASVRCVGYRQVWNYLSGEWSYGSMVERGIISTRQFAKRQYTWLRSESNLEWFDSQDPGHIDQILRRLEPETVQT